jgi:hypothetical protein
MTYITSPSGIRTAIYGTKIERATAALPASALGNIFTVTTGRIVVTSLVGEVTTVLGAGANTLTIGYAPTVGTGSATALGTSATITTAAVGSHFAANPGGATVIDASTQAGVALPSFGFLVDPGAITITTSATVTGSVKWTLTYVPWDDNAVVAAA